MKAQAYHKVLEDVLEYNQVAAGTGEGNILGVEGVEGAEDSFSL